MPGAGKAERGSQAVEFLGLLPLLFLVVAIGWQFLLVAYSLVVAESATRDAARAAAVAPAERVEAEARRHLLAAAGNVELMRVQAYLQSPPLSRRASGIPTSEVVVRAWFSVPLIRLGPAPAPNLRVTLERRAVLPWEGEGEDGRDR